MLKKYANKSIHDAFNKKVIYLTEELANTDWGVNPHLNSGKDTLKDRAIKAEDARVQRIIKRVK
jgi:hypothetical protein